MPSEEDTAPRHHPVPTNKSCVCCFEHITAQNYAEYLPFNGEQWLPALYCEPCIERLLQTQWTTYTEALCRSTCQAEQRRMLTRGPPVNLRDEHALPCPNSEEVHRLWYARSGEEKVAKLEHSLEGEEREAYWKEQMKFLCYDEEDEDEEEENSASKSGKEEKKSFRK